MISSSRSRDYCACRGRLERRNLPLITDVVWLRTPKQSEGCVSQTLERVKAFCSRFGFETPICLAPMAGSTPPPLSIAVTDAGGLGACGALLMAPAGNRGMGA